MVYLAEIETNEDDKTYPLGEYQMWKTPDTR